MHAAALARASGGGVPATAAAASLGVARGATRLALAAGAVAVDASTRIVSTLSRSVAYYTADAAFINTRRLRSQRPSRSVGEGVLLAVTELLGGAAGAAAVLWRLPAAGYARGGVNGAARGGGRAVVASASRLLVGVLDATTRVRFVSKCRCNVTLLYSVFSPQYFLTEPYFLLRLFRCSFAVT